MMPVNSESGWVVGAAYDKKTGDLYVQFNSALVVYRGVGRDFYEGLIDAPSAGTFVHAHLYELPYDELE